MPTITIKENILKDIIEIAKDRNTNENQLVNDILLEAVEFAKQEDCEVFKELDRLSQEAKNGNYIEGDFETLEKRYRV
ncbi:hypothetical protein [Methanobrevibacter filiformis]|uniref:Uncharacterized protein n=1 Tax=Methanobrevibacter filiformis TaxID=55758 RepID=A0A162FMH2_9EURY|nr:hypothetical protein [Methanobrevibacter filiformis]KZX12220.1 hypothetical protein MBFIL_11820 [Methanobrevibacter filiformis]